MHHGHLLPFFLEEKPSTRNSKSQSKVIANIKQNSHLLNSQLKKNNRYWEYNNYWRTWVLTAHKEGGEINVSKIKITKTLT